MSATTSGSATAPLNIGTSLQNGKYRILGLLGQGGFGITYLAEDVNLGRKIAIKEFFPKDFCDRDNTSHLTIGTQNNADLVAKLKERFLKEARNLASLDHPGIVRLHDVFEENDTAYYVMDYIRGLTLSDIVKRDGPFSEDKAIACIKKVGEALEYIHSLRMTHFDVKPSNIMVRQRDNTPILIDFGLSKQYNAQGDATSTLLSAVSHGYSPVELYNSHKTLTFSPKTDVYSLAATLYYLISGVNPPSALELLDDTEALSACKNAKCLDAIRDAMVVKTSERTSSVQEFMNVLSCINMVSNLESITPEYEVSEKNHNKDGNLSEETCFATRRISDKKATKANFKQELEETKRKTEQGKNIIKWFGGPHTKVNIGTSACLHWEVDDICQSVVLNGEKVTKKGKKSIRFTKKGSYAFTLSAKSKYGTETRTVRVLVNDSLYWISWLVAILMGVLLSWGIFEKFGYLYLSDIWSSTPVVILVFILCVMLITIVSQMIFYAISKFLTPFQY